MAVPKPDPKRLALWSIFGATLVASTFFLSLLPFLHDGPSVGFFHLPREKWLHLLALFSPAAIGGTIWFLADKRFKRGYASYLWSDLELEPVRSLLAEEYWAWGSVAVFFLAVLAVSFTSHGGGLIYLVTCPGTAASSMKRLLTPPVKRTGGLAEWRSFKPIHSDHWGEPLHPHRDAATP